MDDNLKKTSVDPRQEITPVDTSLEVSSVASRILNSKSTSTAEQRTRVLELLKIAPQTTYSLRARGISHGAARIMELRRAGFPIISTSVNAVDSDGYTHVGVALYSLEKSA